MIERYVIKAAGPNERCTALIHDEADGHRYQKLPPVRCSSTARLVMNDISGELDTQRYCDKHGADQLARAAVHGIIPPTEMQQDLYSDLKRFFAPWVRKKFQLP